MLLARPKIVFDHVFISVQSKLVHQIGTQSTHVSAQQATQKSIRWLSEGME